MPAPRKPAEGGENLLLIVGQLLEATKAASDALKSISVEVQGNARAIVATGNTVESMEDAATAIDRIVRDPTNPGNLVSVTQGHAADIRALGLRTDDMVTALAALRAEVAKLGAVNDQSTSTRTVLVKAAQVIGAVATFALSLYAALKDK